MDNKELENAILLRKELEETIIKKLESIKNNVINNKLNIIGSDIQMLMMVSDELDDILLNWNIDSIPVIESNHYFDEDDDEDED
jgi:hypothetical protein